VNRVKTPPRPPRITGPRRRLIGLIATAIGFYVVWPALLHTVEASPEVSTIRAWWFVLMAGLEVGSFFCVWWLLALSLRTSRWYLVITSQLAGNAASDVIPGGSATGGIVQYGMLVRGGLDRATVATALTTTSVLVTAVLFALPIFALPAILGGVPVAADLALAAWLGLTVFVLLAAATLALVFTDRPLGAIGRFVDSIVNKWRRRRGRPESYELPGRLRRERQAILRTLDADRWKALVCASGKWMLDYFALMTALAAVGATPRASLALLAYLAAVILGMVPLTPGGLGFVEAGTTSMLVLAGVPAGHAIVAVLAYRLVSYWLPIVGGGIAALLSRRSYRDPDRP
jgi:uncharacterized protein (TIRG00374 family)